MASDHDSAEAQQWVSHAPLITAEGVTARYGHVTALDGLSFSASTGVCALLGPNGAGKTTLLSTIMGLKSFSGAIRVKGSQVSGRDHGLGEKARDVGYLPQRFDLAPRFRVGETTEYAAWCNGAPRRECRGLADRALARVGLSQKRDDRVRTLSGGERQRLGVACAVAREPLILLLDEPTVGLDPSQRSRLREYLAGIAETTCVILATHLLEDVQIVADKVIVLNQGDIVFDGTTAEMVRLGAADRGEYESPLESAYRHLIDGSAAA